MTMQKFLTLSYEKMFPCPKHIEDDSTCSWCELEIKQTTQNSFTKGSKQKLNAVDDHEYYSKALQLPWKHLIHKYWLEEVFRK